MAVKKHIDKNALVKKPVVKNTDVKNTVVRKPVVKKPVVKNPVVMNVVVKKPSVTKPASPEIRAAPESPRVHWGDSKAWHSSLLFPLSKRLLNTIKSFSEISSQIQWLS